MIVMEEGGGLFCKAPPVVPTTTDGLIVAVAGFIVLELAEETLAALLDELFICCLMAMAIARAALPADFVALLLLLLIAAIVEASGIGIPATSPPVTPAPESTPTLTPSELVEDSVAELLLV